MQGGIRRKNDLLPRYKNQGNAKKKSYLTTPMKKVLLYILLLTTVYTMVQTIGLKGGDEIKYELDHSLGASGVNHDAMESQMDAADALNKIVKQKFNNEVAMQQEVKNLENDYKKQGSNDGSKSTAKDSKAKQEVGNDVKAVKDEPEQDIDEQAKKINAKAPYKKTSKDDSNVRNVRINENPDQEEPDIKELLESLSS